MEVKIGEFTIREFQDYPDGSKSVWIEQEDGEGGQFPVKKLEPIIRDFYDKNF